MHTRVVRPDHVTPSHLDRALEQGWFRVGQRLMTCRLFMLDGALRSAIWTRVPLEGHTFTRSTRKLMRRNGRRFRTTVGPASMDQAHQDLHERYGTVAPGDGPHTLHAFRYADGDANSDAFETLEVSVWDGDTLVAFSWFDLGDTSVQSLIGVYDPAYARHSLGLYTMLLEAQHGIDTGRAYFYGGYLVNADPFVDYKLRLGNIEFLEYDAKVWRPWSDVDGYELPADAIRRELERARSALAQAGIGASIQLYPAFEVPAYTPELKSCLTEPLLLQLEQPGRVGQLHVVVWDLDLGRYELIQCTRAAAIVARADGDARQTLELLLRTRRLAHAADPHAIADAARRTLRSAISQRA